ncbi:hypothetical protein D3C74_341210 [compost metagenome]
MVCSITILPAKPNTAPGSAILISPRLAKLAETPPVVGSVMTEMYSPPCSSKRDKAALVLAICMRLRILSCIRAPPDVEKMIIGKRFSVACSMARVIFSPTTEPMLPVKKSKLMTATTTGRPSMVPSPVITASFRPDFRRCCSNLLLYPGKPSGSTDIISASNSTNP